jgi:hypothetical protein
MRRILVALATAMLALPAWAQTQTAWCASPTATDDETIAGCTTLIDSGQEPPANLSSDYDNRGFAYTNKASTTRPSPTRTSRWP